MTKAEHPAHEQPRNGALQHRWKDVVALVCLGGALLLHGFVLYAPCDDTYIYLVYIKNLLSGNGLTFNGTLVQGFSSVGWVMLTSLCALTGLPLPFVIEWLSRLAAIGTVVLLYMAVSRRTHSRSHGFLAGALLVASGDFAFYSGVGMETPAFAGAVLAGMLLATADEDFLKRKSLLLAAVLCAIVVLRPEGVAVVGLLLFWLLVRGIDKRTIGKAFCIPAVFFVCVAALLAWYYGSFVPNTYYAKSNAGLDNAAHGLSYTLNYLYYYAAFFTMFFIALPRESREIRVTGIGFALVAFYFLMVTIQGGDNMVGFRAYVPALPVALYCCLYWLRGLDGRKVATASLFVGAVLVFAYHLGMAKGASWNIPVTAHILTWRSQFEARKAIAAWINEHLEPGDLVALNSAGVIPYYVDAPILDMLGLNDAHIARYGRKDRSQHFGHQSGDGHYVLQQRPACIIFGAVGTAQASSFVGDQEIWHSPDFSENYAPCPIDGRSTLWLRKDIMARAGCGQ